MRKVKSFCRTCGAGCGMTLTLDNADHIVDIHGDRDAPISNGYACYKGLQAEEAHHGPARLLHPLKRQADGSFVRIGVEQALDEVADILRGILARGGPGAVATFNGSGQIMNSSASMMAPMFRQALGIRAHFTNTTIDQSGKFITADRMGAWQAGKHTFEESDVVLYIGTNPLVAHSTVGLFSDPVKRMKAAKARGMKLIVIDPRRTETAAFADLFLQPYPGEDPTIAAGLARMILEKGWHDADFCARYIQPGGLDALKQAVAPFTPDYVERRAGVSADLLGRAAQMFARDAKKGSATTATGPSMSPRSNIADHMIETLNVICGRFRREGDRIQSISPWLRPRPSRAEVKAPTRAWEAEASRIRGARFLAGEMLSSTLADEIVTPGLGQIRALINGSGNPAATLPDQTKAVAALSSLELLVTIDPFMTNTAKLSHYVFSPKMSYERADLPMELYDCSWYHVPWAQYTPEILKPPPGSEVVDHWYVYWGIAKRLGLQLEYRGEKIDMGSAPTTDDLLEVRTRESYVPLNVIRQYPSGHIFDLEEFVLPEGPEGGQFDLMPEDVATELVEIHEEPLLEDGKVQSDGMIFTHRLAVRRIRDLCNSNGLALHNIRRRNPYNPVWMNPADLSASGLETGSPVRIVSDYGSISAVAEADPSVRSGVVMMTHGWGPLPGQGDYKSDGANTNLLISAHRHYEPINSMVRMSGIPVNIVSA
jgi:anaerobic selenocysteine-containing dehydrogenase